MRFLLLALLWVAGCAHAQGLESALMPGPVIRKHVEVEHECGKCHVRGNRAAQPALCLDCHKPIAADIRSGHGYHGRLKGQAKDQTCRTCHTEHKGREARIVQLTEPGFDHGQTDFQLKGKHATQACANCHGTPRRWRNTPTECSSCHRKDDRHKGNLGNRCASCHDETSWKEGRFDHNKTRFPLRHGHGKAQCADCHQEQRYANTARTCVSCHRKNDTHKGTLGPACEKCHADSGWKQPTFAHDRDTRFPLLDLHRPLSCVSCHQKPPHAAKTATQCVACHRPDDAHQGRLGERCETCHSARGWTQTRFDHDRDTRFALRDRHAKASCESCHGGAVSRASAPAGRARAQRNRAPAPTTCIGCHDKDDRSRGHKGKFGQDCASCHNENDFKAGRFDHAGRTRFRLEDKHAKARCESCHTTPLYTTTTATQCVACHRNDDQKKGHKGAFGERCETCHSTRGFDQWRFEHENRGLFTAGSRHASAPCATCHRAPLYPAPPERHCYACHDKEDIHFGSYGVNCAECHVASDWRRLIRRPEDRKEPAR